MTVNDIFLFLEQIATFKNQESYDNSGFLIGDGGMNVKGICLCLDITTDVITEAVKKGANLIISHHPVIFKPVSEIKKGTPVFELIKNNINAICCHTNFDVARMSDIMLGLLDFPLSGEVISPLKPFKESSAEKNLKLLGSGGVSSGGVEGFGKAVNLPFTISPRELALKCKESFKCPVIRYYDANKPINRVGVCSGAGSTDLVYAIEKGCDAFITGDVKHSAFVEAKNKCVTLIDAGHFHTEIIFCEFMLKRFKENFPKINTFIAESGGDLCKYI